MSNKNEYMPVDEFFKRMGKDLWHHQVLIDFPQDNPRRRNSAVPYCFVRGEALVNLDLMIASDEERDRLTRRRYYKEKTNR